MLENIIVVVLAIGCVYWFLVCIMVLFNIRSITHIDALDPPSPETWPKLAVIVAACNEGDTIEAAMRLRLKETYPNIEFLVVDDRSTDDTGVIADRVAAEDPRFRVIHVKSLPEGWLGKVHALQKGVEATDSEWILFTDADVHIEPGVLERVVAWCEQRKLDHLTLLPHMDVDRFSVKIFNAFFIRIAMSIQAIRYLIENPKVRVSAGAGAFNIVRRAALDRTPGMERLRLEVIDDGGLGFLLKDYGASCSVINGAGSVNLCWYNSIGAMKKGFEKNAFALMAYSIPITLVACTWLIFSEFLPFFALLKQGRPNLQIMGGLAYLSGVVATAAANYANRSSVTPAIFYPFGALLMSYFFLRSGILAVWRKGIMWRGTLYPLKALREFDHILLRPDKFDKS